MSSHPYYNEQYYKYAQNIASKVQSTKDFLDQNPMYQERFIQTSQQYPILSIPVVDGIARSNVDIDSNACQAIAQKYSDEMVTQICEDYNYAKETYSMKGLEDEHKIHWLDMMSGGLWGYAMAGLNWTGDHLIYDGVKGKTLKNWNEHFKANRASGPGQGNILWKGRADNPINNLGNSFMWYIMSMENLGQKVADRVPGGSIYAYAKQLNAYDDMLASGEMKEVVEKNLQIKFSYKDLADAQQVTKGKFGRDLGAWEELKEFTGFWKLAKEKAGDHYLTEFNRQMVTQKPMNFRRNAWLDMGSIEAEKTPYWDYLVNIKGHPEEQVRDVIYSDIGQPTKKLDDFGEINYRSLQNPHDIYSWADREFNDNPDKALGYAQEVDKMKENRIVSYSPGRMTGSQFAPVGSTMYNIVSGTVDGAFRIAPEMIGGGWIKRLKYAKFLSKTPADDLLKLMKTGVHPDTGEAVILTRKHAKKWANEFDESYSRFNWQSNPQMKAARKAGKEARKEFKIVNTRVAGWFAQTTDELLGRPFMQTLMDSLVKENNLYNLKNTAVLEDMPAAVIQRISAIDNKATMTTLWRALLGTGDIARNLEYKVNPVAGLQSGLKGSSFVLNNSLNKIYEAGIEAQKSKNFMKKYVQSPLLQTIGSNTANIPSLGTKLGRMLNPVGKKLNKITEHITPNKADINKTMVDGIEAIDDDVLDVLEKTGKLEYKRHLGFSAAFTRGLSSYWNRMTGVRPDNLIGMNDREGAFTNLFYKLKAEDWPAEQANAILKEFTSVMNSNDVSRWNRFQLDQLERDWLHVRRQPKGQHRVLKQAIKYMKANNKQEKYLIDSIGQEVFIEGMPYKINDFAFGPDNKMFKQGATMLAELSGHSIQLFNSAHLRKLMGNTFVDVGDFLDAKHYDTVREAIKNEKFKDIFEFGYIPINLSKKSGRGQNEVAILSDFWISKALKPSWLFRRALTVRPGLDEQIRFMMDPDLTSMLKPVEFMKFFLAGGKGVTAKTRIGKHVGKVIRKMAEEGEDPSNMLTSLEMARVYGANYTFEGFDDFRKLKPKNIDFEEISWQHPKYVNHKLSQIARMRYSPIEAEVARIGWGDELFEWWNSSEAYLLKKEFVQGTGDKYKYLLDVGQKESGLRFLRSVEAKIRMATGHTMTKTVQEPGVVDATGKLGEIIAGVNGVDDFLIDGIKYRGNLNLRDAIWNPLGFLKRGAKLGSKNPEDYTKGTPFFNDLESARFSNTDQRNALKELKKYIDNAVDDGYGKIDDTKSIGYGSLLGAKVPDKNVGGEALDWWDGMLTHFYDKFLTTPLGDFHRATAFKQYRQMYLNTGFKEYTRKAQKHFLDQAKAEAMPKRIIKELQDIYDKGIHGAKHNVEVIESAARAFGAKATMELLYDAAKRHRLSDMIRHESAFPELWFEVMKTYSRLIAKNPYGLRKASLGVKGIRGSNALHHKDQGFFSKSPAGTGEDVYLLPLSSWMSSLVYGKDKSKNYLTNNGYAAGVNLVAQNKVPGAVPWVEWQLDKVLPETGVAGEIKRTMQGGFPGPETPGEVFGIEPNWFKLFRTANVPRIIRAAIGYETQGDKEYLDFDTETSDYWDREHNVLMNKRAKKTLDIAQSIFITNLDEELLKEGKLDRYLAIHAPDKYKIFKELGKPNDMRKKYFTQDNISESVLSYSLDKAGIMFLFDTFFSYEGPSAAHQIFHAEDKTGRFFAIQVFAKAYFELTEKYNGDNQKAQEEFSRRYGLEFGWIAAGKRDKTKFHSYEVRNQIWRAENEEVIRTLPDSHWLLAPDSPQADRDFSDLYAENIKNPKDWLYAAGDLLGTSEYKKIQKENEAKHAGKVGAQKLIDRDNRSARDALMLQYPGFLRDYTGGVVELDEAYQEIRSKWENDAYDGIDIVEGYKAFLPYLKALEKKSMEESNSENPNWWMISETEEAESLRLWALKHAEYIWQEEHPDFYHFWWDLMVKLIGPGQHLLDYVNTEGSD